MPLVEYSKLTDAQKAEVQTMYPPPWSAGPYDWYAFWIKPDGHLTRARGRHSLTEAGYKAATERDFGKYAHKPNAAKGDLAAWKPGHSFSFVRD
jgi:hypothetical protein